MLSRRGVGTSVFAGMIFATTFGVFLIPMLYATFQGLREWAKRRFGRRAPASAHGVGRPTGHIAGPTPERAGE
jgi:hypothetical protein